MVTTSTELTRHLPRDRVLGIFPKDELPKASRFIVGKGIIFNLDNADGEGTHWTCAIHLPHVIIYIDPLGIDAPNNISRFLSMAGKPNGYVYSNTQYQPIRSDDCGKFVTYFLQNFINGRRFHEGLDEKPTKINMYIVDTSFDQ